MKTINTNVSLLNTRIIDITEGQLTGLFVLRSVLFGAFTSSNISNPNIMESVVSPIMDALNTELANSLVNVCNSTITSPVFKIRLADACGKDSCKGNNNIIIILLISPIIVDLLRFSYNDY